MGTRGAFIHRKGAEDSIFYVHFDSYPGGWPSDIAKAVGSGDTSLPVLLGLLSSPKATDTDWLRDSLFCEYAYCVNLDTGRFEFYRGFQREAHEEGRYSSLPQRERGEYWPIRLVGDVAFGDIGPDWAADFATDEDE